MRFALAEDLIHPTVTLVLARILNGFFHFTLYVAVIVLLFLGILYITNKEEGIKKTHKLIGYLAIGVIVVFLSRILIQVVFLLLVG